jgi:hypothetical protein
VTWGVERIRDGYWWLLFGFLNGSRRFGRLLGALTAIPDVAGWSHVAVWLHGVAIYAFDLVGGPEAAQILWRSVTHTRPLTEPEIEAASSVLGEEALRYHRVRIAHGGILASIFGLNNNRAFATWHTINMPAHRQKHIPLLIHELTHTFQYEQVGSVYIGQGLWAQRKLGADAYRYGGSAGLADAYAAGIRYCDYNREQQGQIAQDYCARKLSGRDTSHYEPYIEELRSGAI